MQLLDAEREARQRKKRRRSAQQVQPELRMYARYVNEERLIHTNHPPTAFLDQPPSARSLSFPRKRESTDAAPWLDPRVRGGDEEGPMPILLDALALEVEGFDQIVDDLPGHGDVTADGLGVEDGLGRVF